MPGLEPDPGQQRRRQRADDLGEPPDEPPMMAPPSSVMPCGPSPPESSGSSPTERHVDVGAAADAFDQRPRGERELRPWRRRAAQQDPREDVRVGRLQGRGGRDRQLELARAVFGVELFDRQAGAVEIAVDVVEERRVLQQRRQTVRGASPAGDRVVDGSNSTNSISVAASTDRPSASATA